MAEVIRTQTLRSYILRAERLIGEREVINADLKEVFAEAKSSGLDPKIMRIVIGIRKMEEIEYRERCAMVDVYLTAMKMPPEDEAKVKAAAHDALRTDDVAGSA